MVEENTQEDSEISVDIQKTPQTPIQIPLVEYNEMNTPVFQPFHPILPMTPAFYIPHSDFQVLSARLAMARVSSLITIALIFRAWNFVS